MIDRQLAVYGFGPRFIRRFVNALNRADLTIEVATDEGHEASLFVASWLDGPPRRLPVTDPRGRALGVLVGPPDDYDPLSDRPEPRLPDDASAEELLFLIGGLAWSARRHDARVSAPLPVRYRRDANVVDPSPQETMATLSNLSAGGCYVRSLDPPPIDERIEMILCGPDGRDLAPLAGKVVHRLVINEELGILCRPDAPEISVPSFPGFAVAFEASDGAARARIESIVSDAGAATTGT